MNSLVLINEKEGLRTDYNLKDIDKIFYGKMKDFHDTDVIINYGYKINESAIRIIFYDNTAVTFGKEWHIEFRTF